MVSNGFIHGQREFVYSAMRSMDSSGDGAIDFSEFLAFMSGVKDNKKRQAAAGLLQ